MIKLETELEGKGARYTDIVDAFESHGFNVGGNWDYDHGMFDKTLADEDGETIYLRVPFDVAEGNLDDNDARVVFGTPFVVNHIADTDIDQEDSAVLTTTGMEQFKSPVDKDGPIQKKSKWAVEGEREIAELLGNIEIITM
ncbi:YugN family protein [Bacillus sp. FJAT-27251]|uniref:YugN family protein n=1 Tax=Bacillus sp. FJAT-27251 TaxID=1684142 RepID=UPI0006A77B03|nr:YugN family protein [Bacillus sp. FJAT-27251]